MKKQDYPITNIRFGRIICFILAIINLSIIIIAILVIIKPSILLEWETESELDIVGFNILRGDSESGPFLKINDQIIPPSIDPIIGGDYSYTDKNVVAGETYFYILEDIESSGRTNQHGPVIQKAKYNYSVLFLVCVFTILFLGICIFPGIRKLLGKSRS